MHIFQNRNLCSPKSDQQFFSLTVRGPFHRKDFKLKKILIEKVEKELPLLIMEQLIFYIYIYTVLVVKNHQKIQSRCLVQEFFFTNVFNDINHGYRTAILKLILCGCFWFIWLQLTYCYYEKVHRRCELQFHSTSLRDLLFYVLILGTSIASTLIYF